MVPPAQNPAVSSERHAAVVPARVPDAAAFEQAMVGFFTEAAEMLGLPKSVAAIYAVIFASPRPLSFADVETRLQLSKGSVSQGLRFLRQIGAIRAAEGGERRGVRSEERQPVSPWCHQGSVQRKKSLWIIGPVVYSSGATWWGSSFQDYEKLQGQSAGNSLSLQRVLG